ncbi:MAG: MarR family winged helix-turn-helix transcriptional regulator, partial [Bacillota bacterium]
VGEPTASLLVDRLVRQGWVVRGEDPEDRRRTIASLSKEGTDLVANMRHGGRESLERWLAAMSDGDLAALRRGLQALAEVIEDDAQGQAETPKPAGDAEHPAALEDGIGGRSNGINDP